MQRESLTVLWYETGELVMTVEERVTPVSNFDSRRETGGKKKDSFRSPSCLGVAYSWVVINLKTGWCVGASAISCGKSVILMIFSELVSFTISRYFPGIMAW